MGAAILTVLLTAMASADWQERYLAGERLLGEGKLEPARQELSLALREAESAGQTGPHLGAIVDALGRVEFRAGRYRRAKAFFERSLRAMPAGTGEGHAAALANAGEACQALGELARAEEYYRRALAILPGSPLVWHRLGQALYLRRDYPAAESVLRNALRMWEQSEPAAAAVAVNDLALLYRARHQERLALEVLDRAAARIAPGQARARVLANRGIIRWNLGRKAEARSDLAQALAEMESAAGPLHPDVGKILEEYSAVLEKSGQRAEARNLAKRAQQIQDSFTPQSNRSGATVDWRDLK